jgi:hypothetical protein
MNSRSRTIPSTRRASRPAGRGATLLMLLLTALLVVGVPGAASAAPMPAQREANREANREATCIYRAAFLGDVTIPDNTVMPAGATFVKTWRLRNDGNCPWGPGTTVDALAFVGGSQLGSPALVPLTAQVLSGQSANVSVTLTAPMAAGTYRSNWKLHKTDGATFGVGYYGQTAIYAQIVVKPVPPTPGPAAERINFAPGATVWSGQGTVTFPNPKQYVLRALAGQVMTVAIVSPKNIANFAITGVSDGQPYKRVVNEDRYFTFTLPTTQDYVIDVATPGGSVQYILSIAISPLP